MHITPDVECALTVALDTQKKAHAPYSRFRVGAALKLTGVDDAIGGCNVENASYGATVCAERTAVQGAVARYGTFSPEFLVVAVDGDTASPPCALCLQVLAEFAADDLPVYLANHGVVEKRFRLADLLPHAFRNFTPASEN